MGRRSVNIYKKRVAQRTNSVCENTFLKIYLPSAKKSKLPTHQVFGVFALEVNKILQATPSKLGREMWMCATTIYIRTAAAVVLHDTSTRCSYSSLEPLVPGAAYLVPGTVHASTQQTIQIRGTGSVSRVKTPCEQGLPHCTYGLQAEQRLPHATEENAKRSFAMERGPTAKHHPAWHPQCTQWFRGEKFPLLCSTPKVMPRFSLGDVGEARWPLSHGWTDTSPILPDAANDNRNQGRVVSLSVLSLLLACV